MILHIRKGVIQFKAFAFREFCVEHTSVMIRNSILTLLLTIVSRTFGEEISPIITLPVSVHLLQSEQHPNLNSNTSKAVVENIFLHVNQIWSQAGVRFVVGEIEPLKAFQVPAQRWPQRDRNWVKSAIPMDKLTAPAIHVCFIHDMGPNGFYYGQPAVVKDVVKLRNVSGGTDQHVARVLAHELGHALSLQHREQHTNLMASATTGFSLNEMEIKEARRLALSWLNLLKPVVAQ